MKRTFVTIDHAELDNVIGGIAIGPIVGAIGKKALAMGKQWLANKLSPKPQS